MIGGQSDDVERLLRLPAGADDVGRRLDRVVRRLLPALPLSRIYAAIRTGAIRIEGRAASGSERIRSGDVVIVRRELAAAGASPSTESSPIGSPSRSHPQILFESPKLLAINKPAGLLVHGRGSVAESVEAYLAGRLPSSLSFVPGPLHRLDRNTSGVVLFGKSLDGAREAARYLSTGRAVKLYLALVEGAFEGRRVVEWNDALQRDRGRRITLRGGTAAAHTSVRPLLASRAKGDVVTLCLVQITSGRTHQIRAHAAFGGHPLAGDLKYGGAPRRGGYFLHAWVLAMPGAGALLPPQGVVAPVPPDAVDRLATVFGPQALRKLLSKAPFPFEGDQGIIGQ